MGSSRLSMIESTQPQVTIKLIMKQPVCVLLVIIGSCAADSWVAAPYTLVKRAADPSAEPQRTRFFTGNNALDPDLPELLWELPLSTSRTRSSTLVDQTETETGSTVRL